MSKKIVFLIVCLNVIAGFACSRATETNTKKNSNSAANTETKNMPPGLSASPVSPSANTTPGIPDPKNANVPKNAGLPRGIPDQKALDKQLTNQIPKGTPTPGIPDPETQRKQLNPPPQNRGSTTVGSGDDRPRKVGKQ